MQNNNIAIATITWARNAPEEQALKESLPYLAALNLPVFITDGGSGRSFLDFLQSFSNIKVLTTPDRGVWAQARTSVQAAQASGADFILYTEPDKLNFFRQVLPRFLADAPVDDQVGIVLAARSAAGFATFPAFQQKTETAINQCCAEIMGKPVDYTYGPFLLNQTLVPYLRLVQEDVGWGWRPFTFGIAHRLHYQLVPVTGDFSCPPDQREDSPAERIYRMRQLNQNIQGLVLSTTVALDKT